jgi:hypothetical protein
MMGSTASPLPARRVVDQPVTIAIGRLAESVNLIEAGSIGIY